MILDIIIIAIIALSAYLGYKKGLINLSMKLVALLLSIVITSILYNPIAYLIINTTNIDESIEGYIYDKALVTMEDEKKEGYLVELEKQAVEGILPTTAREVSINIIKLAVFLILLIAIKLILASITALANIIAKLPIIKQVNKVGGILFGVLRGILVIYIALIIIQFVTQINPQNKAYQMVEETQLTKILYKNNPIEIFFI